MERWSKFPAEVRERAVRLVFEQLPQHESQWARDLLDRGEDGLHVRDAAQVGAEGGAGCRPTNGPDHQRARCLKNLERENRELKRANEWTGPSTYARPDSLG